MEAQDVKYLSKSEFARQAGVSRPTLYKWLEAGLLNEYLRDVDGKQVLDKAGLEAVQSRPADNANTKLNLEFGQIQNTLSESVKLLIETKSEMAGLHEAVNQIIYKITELADFSQKFEDRIVTKLEALEVDKTYQSVSDIQSQLLIEKDRRIASLEAQLAEKDRQLERKDVLMKEKQEQEKPGFFKRIFG